MVSDDELMGSLRARMNKEPDSKGAPPPLGPDEVGADMMGPADVIDYVMKSIQAKDEPELDNGMRVLMGFSVAHEDGLQEDKLGQVQPGCFSSPAALDGFLNNHAGSRYSSLCELAEWKPMGPPTDSNMARNAAQKLIVRKDGGNWMTLYINMARSEATVNENAVPRWLITSIYMSGQ